MARKSTTPVELSDYTAMLRRMLRSYSRRVASADLEDLADMLAMRDELDAAIGAAVDGMRAADNGTGYASWAAIGRAAGMSKQAAQQRWGRRAAAPEGGVDPALALALTLDDVAVSA